MRENNTQISPSDDLLHSPPIRQSPSVDGGCCGARRAREGWVQLRHPLRPAAAQEEQRQSGRGRGRVGRMAQQQCRRAAPSSDSKQAN
uniref:Uncharacterized protein n=1 Tax=Oryza meridionalis TaxID=40149 RepID=A0A0E0EEA8_9ORYZ